MVIHHHMIVFLEVQFVENNTNCHSTVELELNRKLCSLYCPPPSNEVEPADDGMKGLTTSIMGEGQKAATELQIGEDSSINQSYFIRQKFRGPDVAAAELHSVMPTHH